MQYINENAQALHNSKSQLVLQDAYEKIKQIPKEDIKEDAVGDEYAKQAAQSKVKGMIKLKEKRIEEKKAGRNTISANSDTFNEGIESKPIKRSNTINNTSTSQASQSQILCKRKIVQ